MNAIDNLGEDDYEALRAKRLQQMKERQQKMAVWRQQGHGTYTELNDEREFFEVAKKSERVLVHFYRCAEVLAGSFHFPRFPKRAAALVAFFVCDPECCCLMCRPASKYCVYMDKQLRKLCRYHMEVKHVKINAEKVPYLCEKLHITTLPSVVLVKNRKTEHTCVGFDEFGGHEAPTAYFAAVCRFVLFVEQLTAQQHGVCARCVCVCVCPVLHWA